MPESFSSKIEKIFANIGQLCVGIDPHSHLLDENGFSDDATGLEHFSFKLLDSVSSAAGIVKPQVSFFERFGAKGFAVLEKLLTEASGRGLLVIADAKRGDIGSTMEAYTAAWLDKAAPFICDALTLSPYLGVASLHQTIATATERGKAVFILCATSNPEGADIQQASRNGDTVSVSVATQAFKLNEISARSNSRFGNVGLVVGATVKDQSVFDKLSSQKQTLRAPILAPGFGAQGANLADLRTIFGDCAQDVICSISRDVLSDGIMNAGQRASQAQDVIRQTLAG